MDQNKEIKYEKGITTVFIYPSFIFLFFIEAGLLYFEK